jgi:hypothetical protein
MECKNCANIYEGKFCPKCGQKAKTARITLRTMFNEVRGMLIHYDKGFFYTVLQLLKRPGHTIHEYLEGKRVRHIKPLKFMLLAGALNIIIFQLLGLDEEILKQLQTQGAHSEKANLAGQKIMAYLLQHPGIIMFMVVPNIAFVSWLVFRKRGYNYAEYLVLNAFVMGQMSLFGIILNPIVKLLSAEGVIGALVRLPLQFALWFGYFCWVYTQFFPNQNRVWLWLKSALVVILGYILMIVLIATILSVIMLLFGSQIKAYLN